ncbi:tryptophan dimethylallyltransferase-domain-containing protein [Mycena metata]|uniref:Tryptophan dimethylallyltransferase-domain-containing protein n=1 Tax=Mycena metata TaxID=1033252 RepID=A0AAD7K7M4_9AGAR|nr:tryptophan dimethylallyltransferase-domain-containing protein [Mycena metata]
MSFWWNTSILPILAFMREANYPEDAVQSYTLFFQAKILPLLALPESAYPSWMTDDHTPLELSLFLGKTGDPLVRFAIEASALPQAGDRSIRTFRNALQRLSLSLVMEPEFNLDWFDICAEELLLADTQQPLESKGHPVSETFIGFDCGHYSAGMKIYFAPRIRALVTGESPEQMLAQLAPRLGLESPWTKITHFLSGFPAGDRPEIEIVAVDCVPGAQNRLKIYFRTDLVSYAQLEYFLTLGDALPSADVSAGLDQARLLWEALTCNVTAAGFRSGLVYYELRQNRENPSSKVYIPAQRGLPNDLAVAKSIATLESRLSTPYPRFVQAVFPHRSLSARSGIHTYACCTVKPCGGGISLYYSPEAFAPERTPGLRAALSTPELLSFPTTLTPVLQCHHVQGLKDADVCFAPDCCIRDLLVFSPTFRMLQGRDKVVRHLRSASRTFRDFKILGNVVLKVVTCELSLIQGRMHFEDDTTTYNAVFTLASRGNGPWRCWALFTLLDDLKSSAIPSSLRHRSVRGRGAEFDALIIGAGQAGLATAARLKELGLKACVIERNSRVGAAWRERYESLQFNTPKDFSHLPYLPFPEDWPMFPSATKVAEHMEKYPQLLGLDVRTSTKTIRAEFDEFGRTWTVQLQREDGSEFTLVSSHLVVATGVDILGGQRARIPQIPGLKGYQGRVLHSTEVRDMHQWLGKRVVVFGAGCSGHDIAMALCKGGASEITMIQRSPTAVISREVLLKLFPDLYTGDNRPPINVADELYLALPTPASKVLRGSMMAKLALLDADLHCKLQAAGFQLPPGESDFIERLTVRRGGYYIDQGCSGLIADGSINLKPYNSIQSLASNGIVFTNGDKLSADTIIFATGFESDAKPASFLDESVYTVTGKIGGIDEEGEAIGLWRPSGYDHLWFAGGDLFNCRFYSRLLALQILRLQGSSDEV